MNKNVITIIIATVLVFAGIGYAAWRAGVPEKFVEPSLTTPILFYGEGCPHCKIVEDYIAANGVKEKLSFEQREVWLNRDNAKLMQDRATRCNIAQDQLGVPLFWDGTTCYNGDTPIIEYFKTKMATAPGQATSTQK